MGGIWVSLPPLCPGGANKQINWSASGRKRRSKGLLLSNRKKKKKGSINGKCKQCTSCHSAPSVANSIARTFFLAVLTSQCSHSMYRHCAGSANTRVNIRWISSSPWGFCAQEWEKVHHKERCHKSLSSHGAMLHAIRAPTLCLTSLHPGISAMPIIRHITKKWCLVWWQPQNRALLPGWISKADGNQSNKSVQLPSTRLCSFSTMSFGPIFFFPYLGAL